MPLYRFIFDFEMSCNKETYGWNIERQQTQVCGCIYDFLI